MGERLEIGTSRTGLKIEKRQGEKGQVARTVEHGAEASIEQLADQWVDGWLESLAQAGCSLAWREEQARRLGQAVRAWPAPSEVGSAAALQAFLNWERQRGIDK